MTDPDDIQPPSPGAYIREELARREWRQADLAWILGRPLATVSLVVNGKRGIRPRLAKELGAAFGQDPMVWMERENSYRLWLFRTTPKPLRRKRLLRPDPADLHYAFR